MDARDEELYRAATMHYLQGATMEAVAGRLGVSRSTVSRMLKEARETGIVRVSVQPPAAVAGPGPAAWLAQEFGVRAHVVPVRRTASAEQRLRDVATVAARVLGDVVASGMTLGVAWGVTVSAIGRQLAVQHVRATQVVQLNGAMNSFGSGIGYAGEVMGRFARAFDATVHLFPVPAFFDDVATKEAMWRERSVRRVLELQEAVDVAVFGVGAVSGVPPSHVYSAGYLDAADVASLRAERVVGDVCTVFLREDGSWQDVAINARASGPTPQALRRIPRRVCVVAGENKIAPLRAALLAGVVTDLIVDEPTARQVVPRR